MDVTVLTWTENDRPRTHDVVVDQVAEALREVGHEPRIIGLHDDIVRLVQELQGARPSIVFNLVETFADMNFIGDVGVAGILDLMGIPHTGASVGDLYLSQDKALTKKLLAYDGVRTADFAVYYPDDDLETGGRLNFPLFVKPLRNDASIGIDGSALVANVQEMLARIVSIHEAFQDGALVEQFVDGREFHLGVLGNGKPEALPPIEIDYSGMPEGMPHVLDAKAKWQRGTPEYEGTKAVVAELPDELKGKLQEAAVKAYRAARVRDYGRVDLRLTPAGDVVVIEVNANCYLERESEFVMAAKASGREYPQLIGEILEQALARHQRIARKAIAAGGRDGLRGG